MWCTFWCNTQVYHNVCFFLPCNYQPGPAHLPQSTPNKKKKTITKLFLKRFKNVKKRRLKMYFSSVDKVLTLWMLSFNLGISLMMSLRFGWIVGLQAVRLKSCAIPATSRSETISITFASLVVEEAGEDLQELGDQLSVCTKALSESTFILCMFTPFLLTTDQKKVWVCKTTKTEKKEKKKKR